MHIYIVLFVGEPATTYNVHLIQHLTKCVEEWGPLWAYTCFAFEDLNHHIKKLFHGTRDMTSQVNFCRILLKINRGKYLVSKFKGGGGAGKQSHIKDRESQLLGVGCFLESCYLFCALCRWRFAMLSCRAYLP